VLFRFVGRARHFHATGFAASANQYLRLDDDGLSELFGNFPRGLGVVRHFAFGSRNPVFGKNLFGLMFV